MARRFHLVHVVAAVGLAMTASAANAQSQGSPQTTPPTVMPCANMMMGYGMMMGPGMMGPGMMGSGMMGSGMMGPGMMGQGMMGWNGSQQGDLHLAANDVKVCLVRWVAMMGNPHLKPGLVTETNSDIITAEIVTVDKDALVQRFSVNRHTGFWQQLQ